jgi:glycosyltransferase involved in cell wall biosynthesis
MLDNQDFYTTPSRQSITRIASPADVALPGFMLNPFPYMARASVFVLSSAWEGLPGVLVEAMACGCPVVSTDCPSGPAEILDGGTYGPLVSVGDDAALAQAILSVLDSPPTRSACGYARPCSRSSALPIAIWK